MDMKYKVRFFQDDIWEVVEKTIVYGKREDAYNSEPDTIENNSVYQGSLSDCEAYIRLHEGGYM